MASQFRTERDSMGEVQVPADALYGAQTQRAIDNFSISGQPMPERFVRALLTLKRATAEANLSLETLDSGRATAIVEAVDQLLSDPALVSHFPVDIFQTGSGTSSNMNANEVIATLASRSLGSEVSPNDHVNASQSSNDVIPSALHVSGFIALSEELLPALSHLVEVLEQKAASLAHITKTGRTHLMDAMPVRFDQVLGGWSAQIEHAMRNLEEAGSELQGLVIGGTAVGTGVNADDDFAESVCRYLNSYLNSDTSTDFSSSAEQGFYPANSRFAGMGAQDVVVAVSGALKTLAVALMKISNDLRWMNSGPLAGLGEIELPALQPGSSIMPGKVNPVVPEAVAMACAQVIGNDTTITVAGQSGNFELNVMLPLFASRLLDSMQLMSRSATSLADDAILGFTVRETSVTEPLAKNPVLVTALNPVIGYLKAAEVAKAAYQQGRPVLDVAAEMTDLSREELESLMDPQALTESDQSS